MDACMLSCCAARPDTMSSICQTIPSRHRPINVRTEYSMHNLLSQPPLWRSAQPSFILLRPQARPHSTLCQQTRRYRGADFFHLLVTSPLRVIPQRCKSHQIMQNPLPSSPRVTLDPFFFSPPRKTSFEYTHTFLKLWPCTGHKQPGSGLNAG